MVKTTPDAQRLADAVHREILVQSKYVYPRPTPEQVADSVRELVLEIAEEAPD